MRPTLLVLLIAAPHLALAQGPPLGTTAPRTELNWDARASAGATMSRLRLLTVPDEFLWAGTVSLAGGVSYRGRPHGGVSLKASLDVSYPDVPTLLSVGVGFNYYPFIGSPAFLRLSAGPTIVFGVVPGLGVGGEIEFHARRWGQLGFVAALGGYFRQRDFPINELWGVRLTAGVSFGGKLR